jgi:hypothetical protein
MNREYEDSNGQSNHGSRMTIFAQRRTGETATFSDPRHPWFLPATARGDRKIFLANGPGLATKEERIVTNPQPGRSKFFQKSEKISCQGADSSLLRCPKPNQTQWRNT